MRPIAVSDPHVMLWPPYNTSPVDKVLDPYTPEDRLLDELAQLPTPDVIRALIELMKPIELRELSEGVLNDCIRCIKVTPNQSTLEIANIINCWIATAEETVSSRKKLRFIKAARDRNNPQTANVG